MLSLLSRSIRADFEMRQRNQKSRLVTLSKKNKPTRTRSCRINAPKNNHDIIVKLKNTFGNKYNEDNFLDKLYALHEINMEYDELSEGDLSENLSNLNILENVMKTFPSLQDKAGY